MVNFVKLFLVVIFGFASGAQAAPGATEDRAKLFSKINVYENNQFGMNINGVWYWMNNPHSLVAIDTGGIAYNLVDIASFERLQVRGGNDALVMHLRTGDIVKTTISEAKWIACREVEVGRAACEKGGRTTGMTYADRRNDLDLVFSHAVVDNIRKIRLFHNAISTTSNSRPDWSAATGTVHVLVNSDFKLAQQPFVAYTALLAAKEAEHKEADKVASALEKQREPETRARLEKEAQQERDYWKAPTAGARIFCETGYGVGANPGSPAVSLADADSLQCRGHSGKEVRLGLLEQSGWKVVEQSSRPHSDSQYLVYAQVVLQKMK